jgi:hypothetical protein
MIDTDDRYDRVCAEFCSYGLCSVIQFYRPERYKDDSPHRNGIIGCMESHQTVCRSFPSGVFVFEDDVLFNKKLLSYRVRLKHAFETAKEMGDGCFYLGCFPLLNTSTKSRGVRHVYGAMGAHALYYGPSAIRSLLELYPGSHCGNSGMYPIFGHKIASMFTQKEGQVGHDCVLSCRSDNLCFWPMLAYQCGYECCETAATTNPKGSHDFVQRVINRPYQCTLSSITYGGIVYIVFFMLFITAILVVFI